MSLGVIGPLGIYVVMKCVERGHRLCYDPFRCISQQPLSLGILGSLGTNFVGSNALRGVIGFLMTPFEAFHDNLPIPLYEMAREG